MSIASQPTTNNPYGAPQALGQSGMTRSPIVVGLFLPVITLGIYSLVWYYKINKELRDLHPSIKVDPALAALSLIIPIASLVSIYNTGKRIEQAQQLARSGESCSAGLGLVLGWLVGLHGIYYQSQLNSLWTSRR